MPNKHAGTQMTIVDGIRGFGVASPNTVAVVDADRQLTYAELRRAI